MHFSEPICRIIGPKKLMFLKLFWRSALELWKYHAFSPDIVMYVKYELKIAKKIIPTAFSRYTYKILVSVKKLMYFLSIEDQNWARINFQCNACFGHRAMLLTPLWLPLFLLPSAHSHVMTWGRTTWATQRKHFRSRLLLLLLLSVFPYIITYCCSCYRVFLKRAWLFSVKQVSK